MKKVSMKRFLGVFMALVLVIGTFAMNNNKVSAERLTDPVDVKENEWYSHIDISVSGEIEVTLNHETYLDDVETPDAGLSTTDTEKCKITGISNVTLVYSDNETIPLVAAGTRQEGKITEHGYTVSDKVKYRDNYYHYDGNEQRFQGNFEKIVITVEYETPDGQKETAEYEIMNDGKFNYCSGANAGNQRDLYQGVDINLANKDVVITDTTRKYTVTFYDPIGDENVRQYVVESGTTLTGNDIPAAPQHEGYKFNGWDTNMNGVTVYTSYTIKAKYEEDCYTVHYYANGHGTAPADAHVQKKEGAVAPNPGALTDTPYIFTGWYSDSTCKNAYDFSTPLTGDLDLYAGWETPSYTVSFDMCGHGDAIDSQTVEYPDKASRPDDPSENGWSFNGWYTDASYSKTFDFDTPIEGDTTVYAKWTAIEYTVIIKKVDNNENLIVEEDVQNPVSDNLTIGDTFSADSPEFSEYTINNEAEKTMNITVDADAIANANDQNEIVYLVKYTKNDAFTLTVVCGYMDGDTFKPFGESETVVGSTRKASGTATYTVKDKNGYDFKSIEKEQGDVTCTEKNDNNYELKWTNKEGNAVVRVIYAPEEYTLVINYVDNKGNVIDADFNVNKTVVFGSDIKEESPVFTGYELAEGQPDVVEGTAGEGALVANEKNEIVINVVYVPVMVNINYYKDMENTLWTSEQAQEGSVYNVLDGTALNTEDDDYIYTFKFWGYMDANFEELPEVVDNTAMNVYTAADGLNKMPAAVKVCGNIDLFAVYEKVAKEAPTPGPDVPEPGPDIPIITSKPTPEPTPEVTPEPTPEVTPVVTPEPTPEPTPEVTPEVTPEPVEEPEEIIEIEDVETPEGDVEEPEVTPEPVEEPEEVIDIELPEVPEGDLPKTGTAPVGLFYGLGSACVAFGGLVSIKARRKEDEE